MTRYHVHILISKKLSGYSSFYKLMEKILILFVEFVTHTFTHLFFELKLWVEDKISKVKSCFQFTILVQKQIFNLLF